MLLSRVAESLYWSARYLERAKDTARIIREHTNLIVDLPYSSLVSWEPLLAIVGTRVAFDEGYRGPDEASVMRWLISDRTNGSSLLRSVESARENLRRCREVLPREAWQAMNDLFLYVLSGHPDGVPRAGRSRFLERIVIETQRIDGILAGTMSRDEAFEIVELGRSVERADMITRVLDVRANALSAVDSSPDRHPDAQWASVLRSLSAFQMFRRSRRVPVTGEAVVGFLLFDERFPRALQHCLLRARRSVAALPLAASVSGAIDAASAALGEAPESVDMADLHGFMDRLQAAIGEIHDAVADAYFLRQLAPV